MSKVVYYTVDGTQSTDTTSYYYNGGTPTSPGSPCLTGISNSLVVTPDGGWTTNIYQAETSYYANYGPRQGLVVQEKRPDGSVLGRQWETNQPAGRWGVESNRSNLYVSWEYETAVDSSGSPVIVKTRQFVPDQNGNQVVVQDRAWSGWTGTAPSTPTVGALARVTNSTPLYPAPVLNSSTSNANLYLQTTAPAIWNLTHERTITDGGGILAPILFTTMTAMGI